MTFFEWLEIRRHNAKINKKSPAQLGDITASNYMEAIQKAGREGVTLEGDVYKTMTHVGPNRWRAGVEEFKK